jgi:hypothetical protein
LGEPPKSPIEQVLGERHREKRLREESLGPIVAAVGLLRESCATVRLVLDDMETSLTHHLELLDALLRDRAGSRWWEQLRDPEGGA